MAFEVFLETADCLCFLGPHRQGDKKEFLFEKWPTTVDWAGNQDLLNPWVDKPTIAP